MRAASVVVLPEPVGPPIEDESARKFRQQCDVVRKVQVARRAECDVGNARIAAAGRPRSRCRFIRKRPRPFSVKGRGRWLRRRRSAGADVSGTTGDTAFSISSPLSMSPEQDQRAGDANDRRQAGHEQQVAAILSRTWRSQSARPGCQLAIGAGRVCETAWSSETSLSRSSSASRHGVERPTYNGAVRWPRLC